MTETIELMDFFAANAPAVPRWFEPELPERPKVPEDTPDADAYAEEWFDFDKDEWSPDRPVNDPREESYKTSLIAWGDYNRAVEEYDAINQDLLIMVQWRFTYAKYMMAERERITPKPSKAQGSPIFC